MVRLGRQVQRGGRRDGGSMEIIIRVPELEAVGRLLLELGERLGAKLDGLLSELSAIRETAVFLAGAGRPMSAAEIDGWIREGEDRRAKERAAADLGKDRGGEAPGSQRRQN
jgi:hypothetical protein